MSTTQKHLADMADKLARAMGYRHGVVSQAITYYVVLVPFEGAEDRTPERTITLAKSRAESFRMLAAMDSAVLIMNANEGRRLKGY